MQERPLFVQPHLAMEGDSVKLVEFDVTLEGIIESYKARYPPLDEVNAQFYRSLYTMDTCAPRIVVVIRLYILSYIHMGNIIWYVVWQPLIDLWRKDREATIPQNGSHPSHKKVKGEAT